METSPIRAVARHHAQHDRVLSQPTILLSTSPDPGPRNLAHRTRTDLGRDLRSTVRLITPGNSVRHQPTIFHAPLNSLPFHWPLPHSTLLTNRQKKQKSRNVKSTNHNASRLRPCAYALKGRQCWYWRADHCMDRCLGSSFFIIFPIPHFPV